MNIFLEHLPNELILQIFEQYFKYDGKPFDWNKTTSMIHYSSRTKQLFERHLASKNVRNYLKYFTDTKHQFAIVNEIKFDNYIISKFCRSNFIIGQNIYFFAHIQKIEKIDWHNMEYEDIEQKNILFLLKIDMQNMQFEKKQIKKNVFDRQLLEFCTLNIENFDVKDFSKISNVISSMKQFDIQIIVGHVTIHNICEGIISKFVYNSMVYELSSQNREEYLNSIQINGDVYIVTKIRFNCHIKVYKISKNSSTDILFTHFNFDFGFLYRDYCYSHHIKTSFVIKNSDELYVCTVFDKFSSVLVLDLKDKKINQIYQCLICDSGLKKGIFFIESKILNGVYLAKTEIISKVRQKWTENFSLTFIELKKNNAHVSDNFYSHKFIFDLTLNEYLTESLVEDYTLAFEANINPTFLTGVNVKATFNTEYILIVCFDRILFLQLDIESPIYNDRTKQLISSFLKYKEFGNFSNKFVI